MTKRDTVLSWHRMGFTVCEIVRETGYDYHYIYSVIWRADRPGYNTRWMRKKRATDPTYRDRERPAAKAARRL